ncbi:hypothetical protein Tco_1019368 [Tanacetum coccineum]|uniref:Uncharacterized protein n=1 Tax=Tanacetum coccineum TaxID=301880 RepID=A0ABQ5FWY6_9ASTR
MEPLEPGFELNGFKNGSKNVSLHSCATPRITNIGLRFMISLFVSTLRTFHLTRKYLRGPVRDMDSVKAMRADSMENSKGVYARLEEVGLQGGDVVGV